MCLNLFIRKLNCLNINITEISPLVLSVAMISDKLRIFSWTKWLSWLGSAKKKSMVYLYLVKHCKEDNIVWQSLVWLHYIPKDIGEQMMDAEVACKGSLFPVPPNEVPAVTLGTKDYVTEINFKALNPWSPPLEWILKYFYKRFALPIHPFQIHPHDYVGSGPSIQTEVWLGTLTYRNLNFTFSLANPSKPAGMISEPHVLAEEYKVYTLCYLILIKILAERNNIYGGLPKWHTEHPFLRPDGLNFTSQSDQTMNELILTTNVML